MAPSSAPRGSKRLDSAAATDVGRVRAENQDAWGTFPALGLYVVADGLGGHRAGSVASALAVEELSRHLAVEVDRDLTPVMDRDGRTSLGGRRLMIAVEKASAVVRAAGRTPERAGMATTVVALLYDAVADLVAICHVGDSRAVRIRGDAVEPLTEDHTVLQQWVREGRIDPQEAKESPLRHRVTQALGAHERVEPALRLDEPHDGDVYVLSSDGVHDVVEAHEMAAVLRTAAGDLARACGALIDLANARGGRDNATVVIVRCRAEG